MTLTEQWKKGELKTGDYYVKPRNGQVFVYHINHSVKHIYHNHAGEIKEVLAPVPSYEEWKQLHKFLEEFNALEVAKENAKLKELILQIRNRQSLIREYLSDCKLGNAWDLLYQTENEIDNAIGE